MVNRRIYAGYYRRYDGKIIYVVTMAKNSDTNEEMIIWTPSPYAEKRSFFTMSKVSFCEDVVVDGKPQPKFTRQTRMKYRRWRRNDMRRKASEGPFEGSISAKRKMSMMNGGRSIPAVIMNMPRGSVSGIDSAEPSMRSASKKNGTSA